MEKFDNKAVAKVFDAYPLKHRSRMMALRQLIFDTAAQFTETGALEETLKWGEPSYLAKKGSTVRLAWKEKIPQQYGLYFQCQTSLVETFRELYSDQLRFDGNRAILFNDDEVVPEDVVRHCIFLSLNYHRLKHLPMLGV